MQKFLIALIAVAFAASTGQAAAGTARIDTGISATGGAQMDVKVRHHKAKTPKKAKAAAKK